MGFVVTTLHNAVFFILVLTPLATVGVGLVGLLCPCRLPDLWTLQSVMFQIQNGTSQYLSIYLKKSQVLSNLILTWVKSCDSSLHLWCYIIKNFSAKKRLVFFLRHRMHFCLSFYLSNTYWGTLALSLVLLLSLSLLHFLKIYVGFRLYVVSFSCVLSFSLPVDLVVKIHANLKMFEIKSVWFSLSSNFSLLFY